MTGSPVRLLCGLVRTSLKLSSVASNALGISGRRMLEAIIAGQDNPGRLARLARGRLRICLSIFCLQARNPLPRVPPIRPGIRPAETGDDPVLALPRPVPVLRRGPCDGLQSGGWRSAWTCINSQRRSTWPHGRRYVRAITRAPESGSPAKRAMATSGCDGRFARQLGPSPERRTGICRRNSSAWLPGEG